MLARFAAGALALYRAAASDYTGLGLMVMPGAIHVDGDEVLVLTWKIGKVSISRLVESEMAFDPGLLLGNVRPETVLAIPWLSPHYIDEKGRLIISYQAFLVEAPGLKLVVDTCVGNDKTRNFPPHSGLSTSFLQLMAQADFAREEVDVVLCTHMHYDHVGWNTMLENGRWVPTFPRARYLFARSEYEHWQKDAGSEVMGQAQVVSDSIRPVFDAGLAVLVEMDHRVSNEIRLMPTPGRTPGHVSVVIESEGQTAIITGDALVHPSQVAFPEWVAPHEVDPPLVVRTPRRLCDLCASGPVLLIGTHFAAPAAGHVRRDEGRYRFDGLPMETGERTTTAVRQVWPPEVATPAGVFRKSAGAARGGRLTCSRRQPRTIRGGSRTTGRCIPLPLRFSCAEGENRTAAGGRETAHWFRRPHTSRGSASATRRRPT